MTHFSSGHQLTNCVLQLRQTAATFLVSYTSARPVRAAEH
jgi:hypothetical protein